MGLGSADWLAARDGRGGPGEGPACGRWLQFKGPCLGLPGGCLPRAPSPRSRARGRPAPRAYRTRPGPWRIAGRLPGAPSP